jgi:hypothetical protein
LITQRRILRVMIATGSGFIQTTRSSEKRPPKVVFRKSSFAHEPTAMCPIACNFKTGETAMQKSKIEIPKQYESLFGQLPLLEDEDREAYLALRSAVIDHFQPGNLMEWIHVADLVTKLWEEQRFRRASIMLIRSAKLKAVKHFLEDICKDLCPSPFDDPAEMALKYFSTNPKESNGVRSLLDQHGITHSALQAKAAQLESGGILMFERMIAARENGRRMLRKENEHYARRQENNADDISEE